MMILNRKLLLSLALVFSTSACTSGEQQSNVKVTSVDHTIVKRQSIGNCWLYAQATWLESLMLTASGESVDVSESYWTWWHWHDQLVGRNISEVRTGGHWSTSVNILLTHGFVTEAEFVADEAGVEMSIAQKRALDYINSQLQEGGTLATTEQRTRENVRRELDIAFGSDMAAAEEIARQAADTIVSAAGEPAVTVADSLNWRGEHAWQQVSFPTVYGEGAEPTERQELARKDVLKRVMKALNDRQPVVMTMMIDFNALDITDQTFKEALQRENGVGRQGGHMVVLHDYVVDNVPGVGRIEEGEVSDELKELALEGDIVHLKAKNSWGKNRPDRGLTDGYTRFGYDYLAKPMAWEGGFTGTSYYSGLRNFVLPPGY